MRQSGGKALAKPSRRLGRVIGVAVQVLASGAWGVSGSINGRRLAPHLLLERRGGAKWRPCQRYAEVPSRRMPPICTAA